MRPDLVQAAHGPAAGADRKAGRPRVVPSRAPVARGERGPTPRRLS
jgi:hypothetical protein